MLGTEVEIGTPETKTFTAADAIADAYPQTPHAVRVAISVCGEPARLVQLVPNAFVVRMTSALDELGADSAPCLTPAPAGPRAPRREPSLAGIPVRVWAELGRARMPSAQIVGLPSGAVVELDKQADDAIDLYVNGTHFATGRLVVVDGTDWAVRIEHVLEMSEINPNPEWRWPDGPNPGRRRRRVHAQDGQRRATKGGHEVVGEAGNGVEAIARSGAASPSSRRSTSRCPRRTAWPP